MNHISAYLGDMSPKAFVKATGIGWPSVCLGTAFYFDHDGGALIVETFGLDGQ